jgi:hypothetical protein
MFKLIALVLGLAIGFGGGVYWAHHNPDAAGKLSDEEEKRFLEAQLEITRKIQGKLEQLSAGRAGGGTPGAGFVSGRQAGAVAADVEEVKGDARRQEEELRKRLASLK